MRGDERGNGRGTQGLGEGRLVLRGERSAPWNRGKQEGMGVKGEYCVEGKGEEQESAGTGEELE